MATTATTLSPARTLAVPEPVARELAAEKRHDVSAVINYYRDPGDGTAPLPIRISDRTVQNERPTVAHPTRIRDVTGEEAAYTLDEHGFRFAGHASALRGDDFFDAERVRAVYYAETEALLRELTGAPRAQVFDHKTRAGPTDWHARGEGNRGARGPLFRAHVDQSYAGAELVLRRHVGDAAADAVLREGRRWQIINVWRPILPILKSPLCVASASSIPDSDLVAASILYPSNQRDETWTILPPRSPDQHRWFYKHRQTPAEVLLIKCFDACADRPGLARRAPHSAFEDPAATEAAPDRVSIEARALVFYDE
ncbi:hypothetical protein F4780DRAFT_782813 [Xylariomycetidae sp. FL0641]|nr:hypothetical protein F4780DRAFT_782813 [Xylariomycetidae sp. FL0641]